MGGPHPKPTRAAWSTLQTHQSGMAFLMSSMDMKVGLLPMGAISSNCFFVSGPVNFWVTGWRNVEGVGGQRRWEKNLLDL